MTSLLIATRNTHKTREFAELLGSGFQVVDLTSYPAILSPDENGKTFEENAVLKAISASRAFAGLVVADDSGLEVAALNGAPGIYSARYAGEQATDSENVSKLLNELAAKHSEFGNRAARFCCVIALAHAGEVLRTFQGTVEGSITRSPSGCGGFGYDPVFVPIGFADTFALLGSALKNQISHRAAAITQLREFLLPPRLTS